MKLSSKRPVLYIQQALLHSAKAMVHQEVPLLTPFYQVPYSLSCHFSKHLYNESHLHAGVAIVEVPLAAFISILSEEDLFVCVLIQGGGKKKGTSTMILLKLLAYQTLITTFKLPDLN